MRLVEELLISLEFRGAEGGWALCVRGEPINDTRYRSHEDAQPAFFALCRTLSQRPTGALVW